jgi:hypothetical protein
VGTAGDSCAERGLSSFSGRNSVSVRTPPDIQCAINSAVRQKTFSELAKRLGQVHSIKRPWPQAEQRSARVFQTALGELSDACKIRGDIHRFVRAIGCLQAKRAMKRRETSERI